MKLRTLVILAVILQVFPLLAEIQEKPVEYTVDKVVHRGFLVFDDSVKEPRPGVLVVHEWKGISKHVMTSSRRLAELGYVAFAADVYGGGVIPATNEEAGKLAGSYKNDRARLRNKVLAALEIFKGQPQVDPGKIAAIGYCFGGTAVLELARSGADVKGVVSFHGGLESPSPVDARKIKGKVLVLHGAVDPHVPEEEVAAFKTEMIEGGVDWQLVYYGNAVHSFTSPEAGNDPAGGAAYNQDAARRSWEAMKVFLAELWP